MRVCLTRFPFGAFLSSWQEYPTMRAFATALQSSAASSPPRDLFKLKGSSVLAISRGDLTRWKGDAIVNAANPVMLGGGGVDGAIHRAAGPELQDACYEVEEVYPGIRCPPGEARVTPGFRLEARFVVHTVGPVYKSGRESAPILRNAIMNSLIQCKKNGLKSVAFPAISCGIYGYPVRKAAEVSIATILEFSEGFEHIEFVLFGKDTYEPFLAEAYKTLERVGRKKGRDDAKDSRSRKREQDNDADEKGDEMPISSHEGGDEMDAEFSQETLVDGTEDNEEKEDGEDEEDKEDKEGKEDGEDEEAQEETPKGGEVDGGGESKASGGSSAEPEKPAKSSRKAT